MNNCQSSLNVLRGKTKWIQFDSLLVEVVKICMNLNIWRRYVHLCLPYLYNIIVCSDVMPRSLIWFIWLYNENKIRVIEQKRKSCTTIIISFVCISSTSYYNTFQLSYLSKTTYKYYLHIWTILKVFYEAKFVVIRYNISMGQYIMRECFWRGSVLREPMRESMIKYYKVLYKYYQAITTKKNDVTLNRFVCLNNSIACLWQYKYHRNLMTIRRPSKRNLRMCNRHFYDSGLLDLHILFANARTCQQKKTQNYTHITQQ